MNGMDKMQAEINERMSGAPHPDSPAAKEAEIELLRGLLRLALVDLNAARIVVEADQMATAYGLEQTIDKINAALARGNA